MGSKASNAEDKVPPDGSPGIFYLRDDGAADLADRFNSPGYVRSALASKYEIINEIAETETSTIYRAVHVQLRREVALRILLRVVAQDRAYVDAFHRRSRAIDKLAQSNIVRIYDEGIESGIHYVAMELLKGMDLNTRIAQRGFVKPEVLIGLMMPAVSGLGHAHRNAIVHGDIQCSSIFLHQDGRIILTGFGIEHTNEKGQLTLRRGRSSLEYTSPEEAAGGPVDVRSDMYSLGVVMYRALTGRYPYTDITPEDTTAAIISAEYVPTTNYVQIPQWLENIVHKCMLKDVSKRVQNCDELLALLNAATVAASTTTASIDQPVEKPTSVSSAKAEPSGRKTLLEKATSSKPETGGRRTVRSASKSKKKLRAEAKTRDARTAVLEVPAPSAETRTTGKKAVSDAGTHHLIAWLVGVVFFMFLGAGVMMLILKAGSRQSERAQTATPVKKPTAAEAVNPVSHRSNKSESEFTTESRAKPPSGQAKVERSSPGRTKVNRSPSEPVASTESEHAAIKGRSVPKARADVARKSEISADHAVPRPRRTTTPPPEYVVLPNLTGTQLEMAKRILTLNGLAVGHIINIPDPSNDGLVVRELPKPGTRVIKGSKINLIIGSK